MVLGKGVVKDMGHSAAGPSLLESLWDELDAIMGRLMADGVPELHDPPEDWQAHGEERGRAQGIAYAIAKITSPYAPDVPAIKAEAVERWQAAQ